MNLMRQRFFLFIGIITAIILAACSTGNCKIQNNLTVLGKLPTGQEVLVSSANFSITGNAVTTGSISVPSLTGSESYELIFSPGTLSVNTLNNTTQDSSNPTITPDPQPCIVNSHNSTCKITLMANNAINGNYKFTVLYKQSGVITPSALPNPIALTLTGVTPIPVPGTLAISTSSNAVSVGGTSIVTLTLSNSQNITTPVVPVITSSDTNILQESGVVNCKLTTLNNICSYTFVGVGVGSANVTASANNYAPVATNSIAVSNVPLAGNLLISTSSENVLINGVTTVTLTLANSLDITVPVVPSVSSNDIAILQDSGAVNCNLTTSNNVCTYTFIGESVGTTTVSASAQNYASVATNSISVLDTVFAYISNTESNSYTQCSASVDGLIESSTCNTITPLLGNNPESPALSGPTGIAFSGKYAYIANINSTYTQCEINAQRGINPNSCISIEPIIFGTESPALSVSFGLAFSGNYAYFNNFGSYDLLNNGSSYTQCSVNPITKAIESTSCIQISPLIESSESTPALTYPMGIAFLGNYVYISDLIDSNSNLSFGYTQCSVNPIVGNIESNTCTKVYPTITGTSESALYAPGGITFNRGFAYFTDLIASAYTQCSVANGQIDSANCMPVLLDSSILSTPAKIAFLGQYAYITNIGSNSYAQCNVNESTGIESDTCVMITPTGQGALSTPTMITFYNPT